MSTKVCTRCKTEKSLLDFPVRKHRRDGRCSWCNQCYSDDSLRRRSTPEAKANKSAYDKQRADENREAISAYGREYYRKNTDVVKRRVRNWATKNPAARKAIANAYKARKRAQGGVSGKELRTWLEQQTMICVWCASACEDSFHIDHVVAIKNGGEHELYNLAIACPSCNHRKSAKDPLDFAIELHNERQMQTARICFLIAA